MGFIEDLGEIIDEYVNSLPEDKQDVGVIVMSTDKQRVIMAKNHDGNLVPLPSTFILSINKILDYTMRK